MFTSKRSRDHGEVQSANDSIWEQLAQEPLLEPTTYVPIERGYFRRLFGTFFEHLGSLILLNLAVALQVGVGILVGLLAGSVVPGGSALNLIIAGIVVVLFAGPAFAGIFGYVRAMCSDDERTNLSVYLADMRRFATRSWLLLGGQAISGAVLVLNIRFYGNVHSVVGTTVLMLMLLLTAVWGMAGSYAWPLLVRNMDWRLLLRNSVFLSLAAPASTSVMVVVLTALSAVLVLTRIGGVLFLCPVWAVTENVSMMRLVRKFRERQDAGVGPDTPAGN